MNTDSVKRTLASIGVRASKRLGQNFLIDERPALLLARAVGASPSDTVVEVGAGLGALTHVLAERAGRVIAVEKDRRLASFLKQEFSASENVEIVEGDIFDLFPREWNGGKAYLAAGNLPYASAAAIVRGFLELPRPPERMAVLVQKEVADRMTASPPNMSMLSLGVRAYGTPSRAGRVGRSMFWPRPEVDSAIVAIKDIAARKDKDALFRAARAGFSHPRKKIGGNVAGQLGIPRSDADTLLKEADVDPDRRAETLSLEEWERVARILVPARELS